MGDGWIVIAFLSNVQILFKAQIETTVTMTLDVKTELCHIPRIVSNRLPPWYLITASNP